MWFSDYSCWFFSEKKGWTLNNSLELNRKLQGLSKVINNLTLSRIFTVLHRKFCVPWILSPKETATFGLRISREVWTTKLILFVVVAWRFFFKLGVTGVKKKSTRQTHIIQISPLWIIFKYGVRVAVDNLLCASVTLSYAVKVRDTGDSVPVPWLSSEGLSREEKYRTYSSGNLSTCHKDVIVAKHIRLFRKVSASNKHGRGP